MFFLSAVLIFALVFVLVYNPLNPPPQLDRQVYTGVLVGSGFVVLLLSRLLMHLLNRKQTLLWMHFFLWAGAELMLFVFGLALFAYLISPGQHFFALVGRVALDVASILFVPYTFTLLLFLLDERNTEIEELRSELEGLQQQAVPPAESFQFCDRAGRTVFATHGADILYVEAADNYCIIHYLGKEGEETFILNNTMKYFETWKENTTLLRCHRSFMVNIENVKLLRKEGDSLILEIAGCNKTIPVSRTYKSQVVDAFSLKK